MSFPFDVVTSGRCQDSRSGRREQRQDPDQIIRLWTAAPYNIGIATGPSGLLVIDCDLQRGADHPQWQLLGDGVELAGHRLPRTFSVRTPSGGLHLYFTAPRSTAW